MSFHEVNTHVCLRLGQKMVLSSPMTHPRHWILLPRDNPMGHGTFQMSFISFWTSYKENHAVNLLLCVASFVQHFACEVHPCCLWQHFLPFNCCRILLCMQIPNSCFHFIADSHLDCHQILASLNNTSMHECPYKFLLVKVHMHFCRVYTKE